jgi:hypothetical protein
MKVYLLRHLHTVALCSFTVNDDVEPSDLLLTTLATRGYSLDIIPSVYCETAAGLEEEVRNEVLADYDMDAGSDWPEP